MRRMRLSKEWIWPIVAAGSLFFGIASAQQDTFSSQALFAAPILTLDQDRLFSESLFGRRVQGELEATSRELAERNRQITAELTEEEKELTEKRKQLSTEEFRALADAFDEKVTQLRTEQDARIRQLQRRREAEQRAFSQRVAPILTELVLESGAVAILDERAVILSADQIDVTERAIKRIDSILGDGGSLGPEDVKGQAAPTGDAADEAPEAATGSE